MEQPLYDLGLLREMDDDEYVMDIISMFNENAPQEIASIKESYIKKDWDNTAKLAHKFKGIIGMLQAKEIHQLLATLEKSLKAGDSSKADALLENIFQLLDKLQDSLKIEYAQLLKKKQKD